MFGRDYRRHCHGPVRVVGVLIECFDVALDHRIFVFERIFCFLLVRNQTAGQGIHYALSRIDSRAELDDLASWNIEPLQQRLSRINGEALQVFKLLQLFDYAGILNGHIVYA